MNAAKPTKANCKKRRKRRIIDNKRGQSAFFLATFVLLLDAADGFDCVEFSNSFVCRRRDVIKVRRIITKQIVETAKMITSGNIKRKIRIALA